MITHFYLLLVNSECHLFGFTSNSSVSTIDKILSGVTTLGQNGPGNDGREGLLRFFQNTSITRASLSYCLVAYAGHSSAGVLLHFRNADGLFHSHLLPTGLGDLSGIIIVIDKRMLYGTVYISFCANIISKGMNSSVHFQTLDNL